MRRGAQAWLAAVLGVCAVAQGVRGADLALRPSIRLESPRAVTVGDVVEGDGVPGAIASAVVLSEEDVTAMARRGAKGVAVVRLQDVRSAISDAALPTAGLAFSGSSCVVRVDTLAPAPAAVAARVGIGEPAPIDLSGPLTVRTRVVQALLAAVDVPETDFRVGFDARDEEFLNTPENNRSVVARPLNSPAAGGTSGQVLVEARLIENGVQSAARTIPARVLVRQTVLKLTRELARRQPVPEDGIERLEQWVSPGAARGAADLTAEQAVGQLARSRLSEGTVLTQDLLVPPIVVRRNETLDVWIYKGGLAVKARATALKDGAVGDVIGARLDRQRAVFQVKIDGERRGVMVE